MSCKALRWEVENSTGSAACAISKAAPLQTSPATCLQQHPPGWADGAAFCPQRAAGRAGPWPRCEGLGQRRELAEGRAACAPRGAEHRGDGCSLLQLMPLLRLGREAKNVRGTRARCVALVVLRRAPALGCCFALSPSLASL